MINEMLMGMKFVHTEPATSSLTDVLFREFSTTPKRSKRSIRTMLNQEGNLDNDRKADQDNQPDPDQEG